ncbi:MAG: dephospho-CoA kinase [Steroidobacteraceae bacterium]
MAPRPPWIGLTGGIASGKSVVAAEFARLGIAIIDGDMLAREVVLPGQPALQAIVERFGATALDASGQLDRPRMRERIFANPADKLALEAILHPTIRAAQQAHAARANSPYQIHVMPLLIETQSQSLYDRILVIDCPAATQLARLLLRDGITPQLAERILAAQASREQRLAQADDVINNSDSLAELPKKIAFLHQRYLQLADRQ